MPKRTGRPWQRRKARIIRRDSGICHICGHDGADSADHIVPVADGGTDADANLAAVHHDTGPRCNRVKGAGTTEDARQRLGLDRSLLGAGFDW